jgi:hypothetical protein
MLVRKLTFFSLYIITVGLIIYIVLEFAASVILAKHIENKLACFEGILQSGENILEIKPNYEAKWKSQEFNISIKTNSRGYREDFDFEDNRIDVAFMGDSFTFGQGVNVIDRYSNVAARQYPEMTVVSLSYNNGFQPEHYEYFLDQHREITPTILFIGLYLGNDLDSDLNETLIERDSHGKILRLEVPYRRVYRGTLINKPNYRYDWFSHIVEETNIGKILATRINASPKLRLKFAKKQKILPNTANRLSTEHGDLDPHNLRSVIALKRIDQIIKSRKGELHVLLIPQNFLVGRTNNPHVAPDNRHLVDELRSRNGLMKAIMALCENDGLKCHDLSRILTADDYFEADAHWNENGHAKVGKLTSGIIASILYEQ